MSDQVEPRVDAETAETIDLLLPFVERFGWTKRALTEALAAAGRDAGEAEVLFPNGAAEMLDSFFTVMLDRAVTAAQPQIESETRLSKKVRAVVAALLATLDPHKEAVRRAFAHGLLPHRAAASARILSHLADRVWDAAGDQSEDVSWYTKRASLAAILVPTLLYWLNDVEADQAGALAFFDRRLQGLGRVGRIRSRVRSTCTGMIGPRMRRPGQRAA
ncbi:COQ9 family protein [Acidisoma sp. 7E03]